MRHSKINFIRRSCEVLGPTILLFAWLAQQALLDRWNGELARLELAEGRWDVYRSNHYVFNALRPSTEFGDTFTPSSAALRWQVRNLDVGMENLEKLIPAEILRKHRAAEAEAQDGGFGGPDGEMDLRFKVLKRSLDDRMAELQSAKSDAQSMFWSLYLLGATLSLAATILRERMEQQLSAATRRFP